MILLITDVDTELSIFANIKNMIKNVKNFGTPIEPFVINKENLVKCKALYGEDIYIVLKKYFDDQALQGQTTKQDHKISQGKGQQTRYAETCSR